MSFKNAIQLLINRFGLVWSLLLYFVIVTALLAGISLPFLLPIINALKSEGVFEILINAHDNMLAGGGLNVMFTGIADAVKKAMDVIASDRHIGNLSISFVVVVIVFAFRIFNGFYEIPLADVTVNWMSSHAKFGFFSKCVSDAWVSFKFLLCKLLYSILFDLLTGFVYYLIIHYVKIVWLVPFLIVLFLVLFLSLRFSISFMWAARVVEGGKIFQSFAYSAKQAFKNFGSVYSTFVVYFTVVVALNLFVGIFTFGMGILITAPICVLLCTFLNNALTFNKSGRRYYLDNGIYTPFVPEGKITHIDERE